MDKLKYEVPSITRKNDAIEFINEFYEYNSEINGVGGLTRFVDDYEGWLKKLEEDYKRVPTEEKVPSRTYFLVRENDNKIIGMVNIRLALNDKLRKVNGHIGYCIRPTERRKGYNKVNLYLALKVCKEHNIKEVFMDCDKDNIGSAKTMQALGAKLIREYYEDREYHTIVQDYIIDVDKTINKYSTLYEQ